MGLSIFGIVAGAAAVVTAIGIYIAHTPFSTLFIHTSSELTFNPNSTRFLPRVRSQVEYLG